jgi:poly(hydroxyalkanoate) depolymerase family esterase
VKQTLFLLLLTFILSSGKIYTPQEEPLKEVENFGDNPGNLKMFLHNKFSTDSNALPLVIVLHGCGQTAKDVADLTGWNKLADLNQFIVLYPQQKFVNNPDLCFNWFLKDDIEKDQGECESIFQMISYVQQHYAVDASKIFVTGLSAGAAMAVVMLATHPELFKCGAIFAGCAYKIAEHPVDATKAMWGQLYIPKEQLAEKVRQQNPAYAGRYPALIIYQGLDDLIVSCKSTPLLINQWTSITHCDTIADKTEKQFMGVKDITRSEYADSSGRTSVIYYEINNLGHALLVKPGKKEDEGGRTGLFGVNKGFHSTYQTAKEFGIIDQ